MEASLWFSENRCIDGCLCYPSGDRMNSRIPAMTPSAIASECGKLAPSLSAPNETASPLGLPQMAHPSCPARIEAEPPRIG